MLWMTRKTYLTDLRKVKPHTDDKVFLDKFYSIDKFFLDKEPCSKAGMTAFAVIK